MGELVPCLGLETLIILQAGSAETVIQWNIRWTGLHFHVFLF